MSLLGYRPICWTYFQASSTANLQKVFDHGKMENVTLECMHFCKFSWCTWQKHSLGNNCSNEYSNLDVNWAISSQILQRICVHPCCSLVKAAAQQMNCLVPEEGSSCSRCKLKSPMQIKTLSTQHWHPLPRVIIDYRANDGQQLRVSSTECYR